MASPVYSTQFVNSHADGGNSYTVPAGYRAVIRSVAGFNASGFVGEVLQLTLNSSLATFYKAVIPQQVAVNVDMHVVVNEGDTIVVAAGLAVDVVVSGYLLSLP
jgi:hypothetical protein